MTLEHAATFEAAVDWDADYFQSPIADISAYVLDATWNLGMGRAFQNLADETRLVLTLDNTDGRFSPENASGSYYGKLLPMRTVHISSDIDGGGQNHWHGWLEDIRPVPGQNREPKALLVCSGLKALLERVDINLPLMVNVTADEIIESALNQVQLPPGVTAGAGWALGIVNRGELGVSTKLARTSLIYDLEAGTQVYPFVNDNWEDDTDSVYDLLGQVARAERGKLFVTRDGILTFWTHAHFQQDAESLYTLTDAEIGQMTYNYGGTDITNSVAVVCYPREVSAGNDELLWSLDQPITIKPGRFRRIKARYRGENGERLGGMDVQTPSVVAGTLAFSEGSGMISEFRGRAQRSIIHLRNNSAVNDCVVSLLEVRGTKLTTFHAVEVEASDEESMANYGLRHDTLNCRLLGDVDRAQNIADEEILNRSQPRGLVPSVTLVNKSREQMELMRSIIMGTRIAVQESRTGHSSDYFVIGEEWKVNRAAAVWEVKYILEPAPAYNGWLLGVAGRSELGEETRLGF